MSDTQSSKSTKPAKPRADFPLGFHPAGYWCKKIRGKIHYFGPRFDPGDGATAAAAADAAEKEYKEKAEALHAGRKPRESTDGLTVKDAINLFLNAKQALVDSGELTQRSWDEYKEVCDLLVPHLGKGRLVADLDPDDFAGLRNKMAKRWGPVRLGNAIQRIRSVFKHAFDDGLIDRPVRFGPGFKRPSKKTLRLHKATGGPKLFTAAEVRKLLDATDPTMKAMVYLGINAGFGNADCANLPLSAVDLGAGMIDFPRPKTGIPRRCPLWHETVEAIKEVLARRKEPKDPADAGLVFLTARGGRWNKDTGGTYAAWKFGKLLKKLGINGRKGLGLYTLRHTFRTIADEARDQPAADYIMGHEVSHISSHYRETISDERLKTVADHVHGWLFPAPAATG
jgi:integrase